MITSDIGNVQVLKAPRTVPCPWEEVVVDGYELYEDAELKLKEQREPVSIFNEVVRRYNLVKVVFLNKIAGMISIVAKMKGALFLYCTDRTSE